MPDLRPVNCDSNGLADYRDFIRSFFRVADDRARQFIGREHVEQAPTLPSVRG